MTDDEIRSLAISQRLLGTTEIILIHHTDCGMLTFTDDEFKRSIQDETGLKPAVGGRGVHQPGRRRAAVHRQDKGEPVHTAQGRGPRLRLRRGHRQAQRGRVGLVNPVPALVSSSRLVGGVFGVAVLGALMSAGTAMSAGGRVDAGQALTQGLHAALIAAAAVALAGAAASAVFLPGRSRATGPADR